RWLEILSRGRARDQRMIEESIAAAESLLEAYEHGLWLLWPLDGEIIALLRPALHFDERRRLHGALVWPSGAREHHWHGVRVAEHVGMRPETITAREIDKEANVEVRRVLVERFGIGRYLEEKKARVLDDDPRYGTLYRIAQREDEPLVAVRVTD